MNIERTDAVPRRTFLSRLTAALAAFGAASATASAAQAQAVPAQAPPSAPAVTAQAPGTWQPARHPEDDWYDQTTAKHRLFLDTTTAPALSQAMGFARNFFEASASGYKLTDADAAQIICLRHHSTSFAFTDAMWAKYGAALSERAEHVDAETKQPPTANPYEGEGKALSSNGVSLSGLAKRGVRYAVCGMATRRTATLIASKNGTKVDDVFKELSEHLVPNARIVPAGIVAVSRAQEHGYTASTVIG